MTPELEGKITMAELRSYFPALAVVAEAGLQNPLDPDEAAWLDGPAFVRWLKENGLKRAQLDESMDRAVRRWAEGDAVNLGTADRILTDLGHHLHELPDEVWRNRPTGGKRPAAPSLVRHSALRDLRAGESQTKVATRYGVTQRTLRRWLRAAEAVAG